jgi:polysaccharide deacetylase family protein (PEP-CTERM system associated)
VHGPDRSIISHTPTSDEANPARSIALTVDLEEHFQVSGFESVIPRERWQSFGSRLEWNTMRLLDTLASHGALATFFVLAWNADRHPTVIKRIHAAGHEIACHSYAHQLVYNQTPEEFRKDTRRAKNVLENLIGERVIGYRAPSFSITRKSLWALDILSAEGFEYDSSVFPILRDRYGLPGAPRFPYRFAPTNGLRVANTSTARPRSNTILEIPPSTIRILGLNLPLGGGGYLRLFPESIFRAALQRVTTVEGRIAVLYIHPWELDPHQPRVLTGSWLSRFRQYVNLHKTEDRLHRLLAAFRSQTIRTVLPRLTAEAAVWAPANLRGAEASRQEASTGGGPR